MMTQVAELQIVERDDFSSFEILSEGKAIAEIRYDTGDFETQRYMVMVNGECFGRFSTYQQAESAVRWHYIRGTLPLQQEISEVVVMQEEIAFIRTDILGTDVFEYKFQSTPSGFIFLNTRGWFNGCGTYYSDWREAALGLRTNCLVA